MQNIDDIQRKSILRSEAYLRKKATEAARRDVLGEEIIRFCLGGLTACVVIAIAVTIFV